MRGAEGEFIQKDRQMLMVRRNRKSSTNQWFNILSNSQQTPYIIKYISDSHNQTASKQQAATDSIHTYHIWVKLTSYP